MHFHKLEYIVDREREDPMRKVIKWRFYSEQAQPATYLYHAERAR